VPHLVAYGAYGETFGATTLSNWTDVGLKAFPNVFGATPPCARWAFLFSAQWAWRTCCQRQPHRFDIPRPIEGPAWV